MAKEIGNAVYANIVAVGALCNIFDIKFEIAEEYIKQRFKNKDQKIIDDNIMAWKKGYGNAEIKLEKEKIIITKLIKVKDDLLINGAEVIGFGALAGGCNFLAAYPMSPSTGVLIFLAEQAAEMGIIVEQAEDEISVINMALGAWYAGARAMVCTSGGGFALMCEGLSLAGMIESPIVINLAQRPGPATGLPTRTEQGDLELALYAGHGDFPRIILAPGTLEDGFVLTKKAFDLADKFQVPVFILSDQYYMDCYYNISSLDLNNDKVNSYFIKTNKDYQRYKLTSDGVSPRGIPGFGEGLVKVDSDEHDEDGHITEDLNWRTTIVNKRMKKMALIKKEIIAPELIGPTDYKYLIVCWGSTFPIIKEALVRIKSKDISLLYFKQVYPLHTDTIKYLNKAKKTIIIENNFKSQFGNLIKLNTGKEFDCIILKYNGLCFSVEELVTQLQKFCNF